MEQWRDVLDYDGYYQISSEGRVRRVVSPTFAHQKISDADIDEVRRLSTSESTYETAARFGVSRTAISLILAGNRRSIKPPRTLSLTLGRDGYLYADLSHTRKFGKPRRHSVHSLVAGAFIGRADGKHVNHIDGVKTNNRLDNLEYVSRRGNAIHSVDVLGHSHKINMAAAEKIRQAKGRRSRADLAAEYGISVFMVTAIWIGKSWRRD